VLREMFLCHHPSPCRLVVFICRALLLHSEGLGKSIILRGGTADDDAYAANAFDIAVGRRRCGRSNVLLFLQKIFLDVHCQDSDSPALGAFLRLRGLMTCIIATASKICPAGQ